MNDNQKYAINRIKDLLHNVGTQYESKTERLLYQQGVLIAILANLADNDSTNFEYTIKKLKKLTGVP